MRAILRCAAVITMLSLAAPAGAQTRPASHILIALAGQATALSEFCANWQIDSDAVRRYLGARRIWIAGDNRAVFGRAYARAHDDARRDGDYPAACDRALDLYGPQGRQIAGFVRPVWRGACGDCQGAHAAGF
jgi:hypothetical protein